MKYTVITAAQREEIARQRVAQLEGEHFQHAAALEEGKADPNDPTDGADNARNLKTLEARLRVARAKLDEVRAEVADQPATSA